MLGVFQKVPWQNNRCWYYFPYYIWTFFVLHYLFICDSRSLYLISFSLYLLCRLLLFYIVTSISVVFQEMYYLFTNIRSGLLFATGWSVSTMRWRVKTVFFISSYSSLFFDLQTDSWIIALITVSTPARTTYVLLNQLCKLGNLPM